MQQQSQGLTEPGPFEFQTGDRDLTPHKMSLRYEWRQGHFQSNIVVEPQDHWLQWQNNCDSSVYDKLGKRWKWYEGEKKNGAYNDNIMISGISEAHHARECTDDPQQCSPQPSCEPCMLDWRSGKLEEIGFRPLDFLVNQSYLEVNEILNQYGTNVHAFETHHPTKVLSPPHGMLQQCRQKQST